MSSDVECGKSVPMTIIVGVVVGVIVGVLVTAVGIKIYCKLKQKRQASDRSINFYSVPIPESDGQSEPASPDSVTPLIFNTSSGDMQCVTWYWKKFNLGLKKSKSSAKEPEDSINSWWANLKGFMLITASILWWMVNRRAAWEINPIQARSHCKVGLYHPYPLYPPIILEIHFPLVELKRRWNSKKVGKHCIIIIVKRLDPVCLGAFAKQHGMSWGSPHLTLCYVVFGLVWIEKTCSK